MNKSSRFSFIFCPFALWKNSTCDFFHRNNMAARPGPMPITSRLHGYSAIGMSRRHRPSGWGGEKGRPTEVADTVVSQTQRCLLEVGRERGGREKTPIPLSLFATLSARSILLLSCYLAILPLACKERPLSFFLCYGFAPPLSLYSPAFVRLASYLELPFLSRPPLTLPTFKSSLPLSLSLSLFSVFLKTWHGMAEKRHVCRGWEGKCVPVASLSVLIASRVPLWRCAHLFSMNVHGELHSLRLPS